MPQLAESRKLARKHLAGVLQGVLVGPGLLVQAVYDNQVGDFGGQSPVVVVYSGGTQREKMTFEGTKAGFSMIIQTFVLYADEAGTWTEADAEDALDDIELVISQAIQANQGSDYWAKINQNGMSTTGSVEIGGKEYRTERIEVIIR